MNFDKEAKKLTDQMLSLILGSVLVDEQSVIKRRVAITLMADTGFTQRAALDLQATVKTLRDNLVQEIHDIASGVKRLPNGTHIIAGFEKEQEK